MRVDTVDMESIQLVKRIQQELDAINYGQYVVHEALSHILFVESMDNIITAKAITTIEKYYPLTSVGVNNEGKVFALFGDLR